MSNSLKVFSLLFLVFSQTIWAVNTIDVSLEKGQLLLMPTHGGDGSAWGKENCVACHFKNRIHKEAPKIKDIVIEVGFSSCTGCHGQNGTNVERQCTVCHNEQRLPKSPLQKGSEKHDFTVQESLDLKDKDCLTCHHNSDMDGKFEAETDLTSLPGSPSSAEIPYKNGTEFCLRCHNKSHQQPGFEMKARFKRDPLVNIAESYQFMDMHGYLRGSGERTYAGLRDGDYRYGDLVECTDCHAMHGTHNPKLIVDRTDAGMSKLAAPVRDLPVLINIVDGDYSQLCVSCHSMNDLVEQGDEETGNGLTGVHQVGTDCRVCHVHGLAATTGL